MKTATQLMTVEPTTVRDSARVRDAVELFQQLEVRHLPVVNGSREVVGMLSDRDLRALAVPRVVDSEWVGTIQLALDARVSSVMSANVITVSIDSDGQEIIELMLEHNIGAVPVTDADGKLVGIVSYVDLLRSFAED